MKNCIYEPVFGLFLLFNFQIDSALTFSSRLSNKAQQVAGFHIVHDCEGKPRL